MLKSVHGEEQLPFNDAELASAGNGSMDAFKGGLSAFHWMRALFAKSDSHTTRASKPSGISMDVPTFPVTGAVCTPSAGKSSMEHTDSYDYSLLPVLLQLQHLYMIRLKPQLAQLMPPRFLVLTGIVPVTSVFKLFDNHKREPKKCPDKQQGHDKARR